MAAILAAPLFGACAAGPPAPSAAADLAAETGETASSGPSARDEAQDRLRRALDGFGGAERVDRLRTMVIEATAVRSIGDTQTAVRQRSYLQFPRQFRRELLLDGMTVASVVSPEGGFVLSALGVLPLPEENRVEIERNLARSPLSLLKGRRHESFTVIADGEGELEGKPVEYLQVLFVGDSSRLAIERETGRSLELTFTDRPLAAPAEQAQEVVIRYADFREIDGLVYPFHSIVTRGGEHLVSNRVESLQVDLPLDPALFAPPPEAAAEGLDEPGQP
jgi:hypothetical protein